MIHLKRKKAEKMGVRERPQVRSQGHQQWVRGFPCVCEGRNGHVCQGDVEFAHVRRGTDGGTSLKPGDNWGIPLCSIAAHGYQHAKGEQTFEKQFGINMKEIAADLWRRSPHRLKWERKQEER